MYIAELNQNQYNSNICKNKIPSNKNHNIYINGTIDPDYNYNFLQTQRTKFNNNRSNYNTNTTKNNKPKQNLNRYNSYGRMNTNLNNNTYNQNSKKAMSKNKKNSNNNNQRYHKMQNNNNSRGYNNTHLNNQRTPLNNNNNNNKSFIPLGNNKYKTIGDANYSNFGNKIYNEVNRTFVQRPDHNTIDLNNLYSNNNSNINRKYNMKRASNNTNHNYNCNYNTNYNRQCERKNSNYNFKNIDISRGTKKNGGSSRPKTPDFNKRRKSSSRFNNQNNSNNHRAKTPDRNRSKMKLNLNKEYLNTTDTKSKKRINHYNYSNRDYNYTIDNVSNNNGKYKYNNQINRLNTNDYFQMHKKTTNNFYDYKDTINANNTITSNNSNYRRYSYGKINNNNNNNNTQRKNSKRLTKNCSQGNILGQNNYNINLNSNGINHVHKNIKDNNYNNYNSNNENMITPIKYVNQKSNFKGGVQMTQLRPPNNYNIYDDTFQSFGTQLPTSINNDINKKNIKYNQNKNKPVAAATTRNEINKRNYIDNIFNNIKEKEKEKKNNDMFNEYQRYLLQNNNEIEELQYELTRQKNGNYNNSNAYIPATINNIANKTYSYFNNKKENIMNQKENINNNNDIQDSKEKIDIDFNDLDQFSPPYSKDQVNLTNNIDKIKNKSNNKYMNIGSLQDNYNCGKINYDMDFNRQNNDFIPNLFLKDEKMGNNRKAINDFILQLKTNF